MVSLVQYLFFSVNGNRKWVISASSRVNCKLKHVNYLHNLFSCVTNLRKTSTKIGFIVLLPLLQALMKTLLIKQTLHRDRWHRILEPAVTAWGVSLAGIYNLMNRFHVRIKSLSDRAWEDKREKSSSLYLAILLVLSCIKVTPYTGDIDSLSYGKLLQYKP